MFNRPISVFGKRDDSNEAGWDTDRDPQFRLTLLWFVLALPVLAVIARVGQLQLGLQDDFAVAFSRTAESYREIPARDGRILAADGSVLAGDVERYDLAVHFREIQDLTEKQLISKAKSRLSKSDRKDQQKVQDEKQKVIAEREIFWQKLADLAGLPLNDLLEAKVKQQTRIERIKEAVERRLRERQQKDPAKETYPDGRLELSWKSFWNRIQQTVIEQPESTYDLQLLEEDDYHPVIANIDAEMKSEIEGHPDRYPHTKVLIHSHRTYPKGEFASHLIGFRKPLSVEQFQKRKSAYPDGDPQDYHVGDPCGVSGLELSYDAHLKGIRGREAVIKNWRDEVVDTRVIRPPEHGRDLVLTLDSEVQLRAEQLLDAALTKVTVKGTVDPETTHGRFRDPTCPQGGCLVAIDVHTGAILAAAAAPRFDLNLMVAPDSAQWDDVMSDPRSPFLSRATHMALPPGSVFKVISAVASIESGKMPPHEPFYCHGYLDRPDKPHRCLPFRHYGVGHGEVTLADALCRSCNVYFYTAAERMGPQTLVDWARRFGIGHRTGIDLPSESAGHLPAPDSPLAPGQRRPAWRRGDTLDLAIGQSTLTVTPLQIVRAMAAVANGGYLVTPHLAAESGPSLMDESSSIRNSPSNLQPTSIEGLHAETLNNIREGLTMVVHHPRGTGYKTVRMKEVTIAGKTGTAETNGIDHAWFAGYVPAEQPRIAFVVVLQNGGGGGAAAGPVAHEFVKKLVDLGLVTKVPHLVSERTITRPSQKQ